MITILKLDIINYNKTIYIIIVIIESFVAACIHVHASLGVYEQIRAASNSFLRYW